MRITLYDFGKIIIDGETHTRDIIIHPGRVDGPWWRNQGHRLAVGDLDTVWASDPETLIVGTGYHGNMVVGKETVDFICAKGINILSAKTPDAVKEFNRLSEEGNQRVVAALHLTC